MISDYLKNNMPRKQLTPEEHFNKLKQQYISVLSNQNISLELKQNLLKYVLPSLAEPIVISKNPRFRCLFEICFQTKLSFVSKQKYIYHLCVFHKHQLPENGKFLCPNDRNTKNDGFVCSTCGQKFNRNDHYINHLKKVHSKFQESDQEKKDTDCIVDPFDGRSESSNQSRPTKVTSHHHDHAFDEMISLDEINLILENHDET